MSYQPAPFPNYTQPTFPNQQPNSYDQTNRQPNAWQQTNTQPPNDFTFYTPPPVQAHTTPMMPAVHSASPPDPWSAQQPGGPTMRRPQPMASPGGTVDPNTVAFMPQQLQSAMANPMAGMALDYGKASLAKNLSWVMSFLSALKYYFHVNNRYVVAKLRVLLLPFLHSNWKRERLDGAVAGPDDAAMANLVGAQIYKPPRDDINAPDLYIPTMAFITFTLVMGYALGIGNQFHPEVLGLTASRTLILLFFEVLGLKGGLYLISVGPTMPASLLDLVSYAAYKYIHCILMILIGLVLGSFCFYVSILILGILAALFMMRTMKRVCTPIHHAANGDHSSAALAGGYNIGTHSSFGHGKHRRNYFLLVVGGMQILISWFLVRTANTGF